MRKADTTKLKVATKQYMLAKETLGNLELRKCCIEQAVMWPWLAYGSAGAMQQLHYAPTLLEANVIDRAKKIYDWVTAK